MTIVIIEVCLSADIKTNFWNLLYRLLLDDVQLS
jgi:hypothetical protein